MNLSSKPSPASAGNLSTNTFASLRALFKATYPKKKTPKKPNK